MSRRAPPEKPLQRLQRIIIPGSTGGLYTLIPGALGFFVVLALYVHSYFSGKEMPAVTGEMLLTSVSMLGVHQIRGISADRANASAGIAPVPVDPSDPATPHTSSQPGHLPELRPRD